MELARSVVSRFRRYVGERRKGKRLKVRLPFTLSISSSAKSRNGAKRTTSIDGYTLDLSPNGLALIVSAIRLGEQHLVGENRSLDLNLKLPNGPVEMKVTPIRYETFEEDEAQAGYLIGVRITEMPDDDRAKFSAYVSSHRKG
ncbi:MAG TPA: PilZ domain-containing protein [Pyrinomonadaceae bacterium]|nr:PilZ domain-containing protein [Pyrinomonadaceae bacterium]